MVRKGQDSLEGYKGVRQGVIETKENKHTPHLEILESGSLIVTEWGDWDDSRKPAVKSERKKPYRTVSTSY